jgi:AcrR family transcriptional regulator
MQQRSRDRVEQILAAASDLLNEGGLDELSTRALAERSGVPVGTIYRYFENSDAIVSAFLDREMEKLDTAIAEAVLGLERVTLRSMLEAATLAHLTHHQRHPQTVTVWFGGRRSAAVRQRVRQQDARSAAWLQGAIDAAGFLSDDAPPHGLDAVVRLSDRLFEYVLLEVPSAEDQEDMVRRFVDMVASYAERFATRVGLEGLPADQFVTALANRPVHFDPEADRFTRLAEQR